MSIAAVPSLALVAALGPAVEWSAPAGCPERARVLDRARALIGGPADAAMQQVAIRGIIEPAAAGFSLDVDIRTPSGATHKTAHADDCMVLADVAALMVAVAVDPLRTSEALPRRPARAPGGPSSATDVPSTPEPAPPSPAAALPPSAAPSAGTARRPANLEPRGPEPASPPADASPRPRARMLRGLVRASGSIGRGLVPERDLGLGLGAGLLASHLRAELTLFHVFARDARYPPPSVAGAAIAAWGGSVRVGPYLRLGPVELHALASVAAAAVTASGFGARNSRNNADAWVALALVPGLRWEPIPRMALGVDLELEAALRRPGFAVSGSPPLHRAASAGVRGSLVVELRWGNRRGG